MTQRRTYEYIYGGTVEYLGQVRELDGTAWSLGPCDEVRLRAAAIRDLSRTQGAPLAGIVIRRFWFSEIVTDLRQPAAAGADPFCPRSDPDPFCPHDSPDPFRPGGA